MARQLKNLVISEVSSVDRGAGEGVKILLMKRDTTDDTVIDLDAVRAALAFAKADPRIDAEVVKLRAAIDAIQKDAATTDKDAAAAAAVTKFKDTIAKLAPASTESTMTADEIKKAIDDGIKTAVATETAPLIEKIGKLEAEAVVLKMSDKEKAFHAGLSDDKKKSFQAMSGDDREKCMTDAKKAADGDPVVKALTGENTELKKRLQALEDAATLTVCKADAKAMGLAGDDAGDVLMKARAGNIEAIKKVEAHTLSVIKQRDEIAKTAGIFKEFGSGGGTAASAYDQIVAKGAELRKADPKLTEAQAFDKVYNDPANVTLREQHKTEETRKRQVAA